MISKFCTSNINKKKSAEKLARNSIILLKSRDSVREMKFGGICWSNFMKRDNWNWTLINFNLKINIFSISDGVFGWMGRGFSGCKPRAFVHGLRGSVKVYWPVWAHFRNCLIIIDQLQSQVAYHPNIKPLAKNLS